MATLKQAGRVPGHPVFASGRVENAADVLGLARFGERHQPLKIQHWEGCSIVFHRGRHPIEPTGRVPRRSGTVLP